MKAEQDAYDCRHREHGDPARSDRIAGNAHQVSDPIAEVQARPARPVQLNFLAAREVPGGTLTG